MGKGRRAGSLDMGGFVGFDPLKSHRAQILRIASVCVAIAAASLVAMARRAA